MPLSMWEKPRITEQQSLPTIHAALDAELSFIDTADAYIASPEMGDIEHLVARTVTSWGGDASTITVATKGGQTRYAEGGWGLNGRPEYLRASSRPRCATSASTSSS